MPTKDKNQIAAQIVALSTGQASPKLSSKDKTASVRKAKPKGKKH
jgi:hypothetical protein